MDFAVNKTTGELISALALELNTSYIKYEEDTWYADPNMIESYDKEKVLDITKIEVRYRKGTDEVLNRYGTIYSIAPCFFILNKTSLGINTIPESKEHKKVKNWIYNRIIKKNLIFKVSSKNKPSEKDILININELDVNYNEVGIEVTVKDSKIKRADIIIPFNKYNSTFGFGIVIEVQFSKQKEKTTEKRNIEWATKGFSVCWLFDTDFIEISENFIELKEEKLKLNLVGKILEEQTEKNYYELKSTAQLFSRQIDQKIDEGIKKIDEGIKKIDEKMKELNYPFALGECKKCLFGYMTKKKTKGGKEFYGCSNYPHCNHSIWIN
jgi:hypothetical protein